MSLSVKQFPFTPRSLSAAGLAFVGLLFTAPAFSHTMSSNFDCARYGVNISGPVSLRGAMSADEKLARVAVLFPTVKGADGTSIFPEGTVIDRAEIRDGFAELAITLPAGLSERTLDRLTVYQAHEVIRHYFAEAENLQGSRIVARPSGSVDYRDIEDFILLGEDELATAPRNAGEPDYEAGGPGPQPAVDTDALYESYRQAAEAEKSGVRNVPGQVSISGSGAPTGSLAGRIIFTYGGHGRTWDGTVPGWRWQRGITNSMQEDFGNVDGADAYIYHCFNAGATVVPLRPVGYQNNEVVMDNNSAGVTRTGTWNDSSSARYYGSGSPSYIWANSSDTETATATYTPNIPEAGYYPVYTWVNYGSDRMPVGQLYRIKTTGGESLVRVDHRRVGCGWVYLGSYYFAAGSNPGTGSVTISNMNAPGVTGSSYVAIADAIRFGNGMGDVNNGGGISGYSRREESTVYWFQNGWGNGTASVGSGSVWNNSNANNDENLSWQAPPYMSRQMLRLHSGDANKQYALYLGWHSNANDSGSVRGSMGLITSGNTTNQAWWAAKVCDEVDAASLQEDDNWEYTWNDRPTSTYTGGYGEITDGYFNGTMDATIIEVAFHSSPADAALMRDPRVRFVHGRGAYRAAVQYFNNFQGGPVAYLPESPINFRVTNNGSGGAVLNWQAGPTGGTRGQAATGYRVYQSPDGLGWNSGTAVTGLTHTVGGLTPGQTYYFKVAGTNAGGESFASEILAVKITASGAANILYVNGYDRIDRFNNVPRGGMAGVVEQLIHRKNNSYDYVRQHAASLAAAGYDFDSTSNEAVIAGNISLNNYDVVVWGLGEESSRDKTFDATERTRVDSFLAAGKGLFVSGAETAYELDSLNIGRSFFRDSLRSQYASDDSNAYLAAGAAGSVFADITSLNFNAEDGPYDVDSPDALTPVNGGVAALTYSAGRVQTDTFDSVGSWQAPSFSGSTTADSSTYAAVSNPRRQGSGSGDLGYNWTQGTVLREYNSGGATFSNNVTFSLWVYGENSGDTLRLLMRDMGDSELYQNNATVINFTGWREITWNLATDPKTRFAGAGDNVLGGSVRLDSLYLTKTGTSASGHLYFDDAGYMPNAGTGLGTAAVQYSGTYRLINMAFPFEAISDAGKRNQVMQKAIPFLMPGSAVADWNLY